MSQDPKIDPIASLAYVIYDSEHTTRLGEQSSEVY